MARRMVVLDMAIPAMEELGIDAAALGYKLLLYGHFKSHRDTEKEEGMFATMILQLPMQSGHEGGKLEISHGRKNKSVTFDFSRTGYFEMAFFCDCKHKLAEVSNGTRLCLVRSNAKVVDVNAHNVPRYLSALGSVQSQLILQWPWEGRDSSRIRMKVTQLFSELFSRALKHSSHNKKLAEVPIWLGNEDMVKVVVKYARSGDFKLLDDEKDDSESAKTWDDVARDGLKKVINAKICYFLGNGDEEKSHEIHTVNQVYIMGAIYWQVKLQVIVSALYDETVLAINGATLITQPVSKAGFVGAAVQHKIEVLLLLVLLNCHWLLF
ncbi:hypothetical protein SELMODRAFT_423650 [Selaginella moellendorffii]|uniref:Prolyl 4-hydroxylase alpha subunit Fe(2+) 2OG dioxygenase domain-containing protein n=1 Tax=Selaginella moellendorffii TaxID=88036 RepID=D8SMD9_SELML|nr:hypothetical protein SELMODRAFT_423650 [Selaginella moellendorffii]